MSKRYNAQMGLEGSLGHGYDPLKPNDEIGLQLVLRSFAGHSIYENNHVVMYTCECVCPVSVPGR